MAFQPKNDEHGSSMKEALSQSKTTKVSNEVHETKTSSSDEMILNIPKKEERKKKKNYTFSLHPDVREEIERKAKEFNYNSSSELLNELFKPK